MDVVQPCESSVFLQTLDCILEAFSGFIFRTKKFVCISGTCFAQDTEQFEEQFRSAIHQAKAEGFNVNQQTQWKLCHMKPLRIPVAHVAPYFDGLCPSILAFYGIQHNCQPIMTGIAHPVDLLWNALIDILKGREGYAVCYRCACEGKTSLLQGCPPRLPFVFPTSQYLCHSVALHGHILPEDSSYICRSSDCRCRSCEIAGRVRNSMVIDDTPPSPSLSSSPSPSPSPSCSFQTSSPFVNRKRKAQTITPTTNTTTPTTQFSPHKRMRDW